MRLSVTAGFIFSVADPQLPLTGSGDVGVAVAARVLQFKM
jgi:hypothetical protein